MEPRSHLEVFCRKHSRKYSNLQCRLICDHNFQVRTPRCVGLVLGNGQSGTICIDGENSHVHISKFGTRRTSRMFRLSLPFQGEYFLNRLLPEVCWKAH